MSEQIRVRVVEFGDRKHYQLQWTCPNSGKKKTKSSGIERTGKKKELDAAQRKAGEHEKVLTASGGVTIGRVSWDEFLTRYERDVIARRRPESQRKMRTTLDAIEDMLQPKRLTDLTPATIAKWIDDLHEGRAVETVRLYCRNLRAALNWAVEAELLPRAPKFRMPESAGGDAMKGRPFCGEEYDRIKAAIPNVIPAAHVASWGHFLDCLWLSGFRLGEAMALSWDSSADITAIVCNGSRPVVRFHSAGQKSKKAELWPCPPEFGVMLQAVPEEQRSGFVFAVPGFDVGRCSQDRAARLIAKITKAAGVMVEGERQVTAHDFRRSFATRWSKRLMPVDLKRLMRHATIETTLAYYVSQDAEKMADELWKQFAPESNTSGNTTPETSAVSAE